MQITKKKKKKNHKVTQRTNYASWSFFYLLSLWHFKTKLLLLLLL